MGRRRRLVPILVLLIISSIIAVVAVSGCGKSGNRQSSQYSTGSPAPEVQPDQPERDLASDDEVAVPAEAPKEVEKPPVKPTAAPDGATARSVSTDDEESASDTVVTDLEDEPQPTVRLTGGEAGQIALTFDAGASSAPTPALLDVLSKYGVKSTFFLTGKWVEQNHKLTKRIVAEGHEIGNHTYSHPDLRNVSDEKIREQFAKTESLIQSVAGVSSKPYFRPPYGGRDARVLKVAADEGYECIYWTADSWDAFKKGIKPSEIKTRVLDRAKDGAIVLMHCGAWPTVEAVPGIIEDLDARGYDLVKVSELDNR